MKQGVLVNNRVRLLMKPGDSGFRGFGRRCGERRRKSVRGCIVGQDLSVLNLVVIKQGESDIPGLTDRTLPAMRGPKRASNIRKLFNLSKEDNVQLPKYVNLYRRSFESANGKKHSKAPKIQRLVTPQTLQRKRAFRAVKAAGIAKATAEKAAYHKLMVQRVKEARERRSASIAKRRQSAASN